MLQRSGAYYVEPQGDDMRIFRMYGPFERELDAFRAAFFMLSRDLLYASTTKEFSREVRRCVTFHEPGEIRYVLQYEGWRFMGYSKGAKLIQASRVPVHLSWKGHSLADAEIHVLNNAAQAEVISAEEEERLLRLRKRT